jgi:hypothetical protein
MGVFYTNEQLKKVAPDSEVKKIEMFLYGNGGAPSVRHARPAACSHTCTAWYSACTVHELCMYSACACIESSTVPVLYHLCHDETIADTFCLRAVT